MIYRKRDDQQSLYSNLRREEEAYVYHVEFMARMHKNICRL